MSDDGGASAFVWAGLSAASLASFWAQATVTEERLVPALNVIADYYRIPDDIAGATLMAAGASSPELFSSIVALFVTHSSLGLGTIVGSEIFNQLVICAGAVYASKTGRLQLDRVVVTREAGFYALAILLLYLALRDVEPVAGDAVDHIFISFGEACLVFAGYVAYVLVCANMDAVVRLCSCGKGDSGAAERAALRNGGTVAAYGAGSPPTADQEPIERNTSSKIDVGPMCFVMERKNLSAEPAANWAPVEYYRAETGNRGSIGEFAPARSSLMSARGSNILSDSVRSLRKEGPQRRGSLLDMVGQKEPPSACHNLYDVCNDQAGAGMSCFLWQKSLFYTRERFGAHAWHLRWFTFGVKRLTSVPDRQDAEKHKMRYPHFRKILTDEGHRIIEIINPDPLKRNYTLMAPSPDMFQKVVQELERLMEYHSGACDEPGSAEEPDIAADADPHPSLLDFPSEGGNMEVVFWILLSPLRAAMHFTVPDVRHLDKDGNSQATIGLAYVSTLMCLLWLIAGSLAMVSSLEALADLMDIPDAVVGFTVSAAGTSLPNYVASKVSAENGFGNQAVSNAFGSNTFNIMVGLGLPWMLYTSIGTGFEPYNGLRNESILQSILILAGVLLIFIVLMVQSGFVLHKWHGHLFLLLYVAYLAFEIGQVYIGGVGNQA